MGKEQDIIVFKDNDINIEVRIDMNEETVWLTQKQISELFNRTYDNINLHIKNIFKEGELIEKEVSEYSSVTASDEKNIGQSYLIWI